ncbi:hypothetical protein AB0I61_12895 [Polymorphospora rubra]
MPIASDVDHAGGGDGPAYVSGPPPAAPPVPDAFSPRTAWI